MQPIGKVWTMLGLLWMDPCAPISLPFGSHFEPYGDISRQALLDPAKSKLGWKQTVWIIFEQFGFQNCACSRILPQISNFCCRICDLKWLVSFDFLSNLNCSSVKTLCLCECNLSFCALKSLKHTWHSAIQVGHGQNICANAFEFLDV